MGRPRTGSVWQTKGRYYARVTWIDRAGKRHDRKRLAMDETHARSLVPDLLKEILREEKYRRQQPKRAKKYKRDNLLIYCIQILDGATCPVKIGTSSNIPKRIKMILTHQPHDVRLLASWPGSVRDRDRKQRNSRGSNQFYAKLTEDQIPDIRYLFSRGMNRLQLAGLFNVSNVVIGRIIEGTGWKHVERSTGVE